MSSLGGFNIIDNIKASVEAAYPGVISCADILALTMRDATFLVCAARTSLADPLAGRFASYFVSCIVLRVRLSVP